MYNCYGHAVFASPEMYISVFAVMVKFQYGVPDGGQNSPVDGQDAGLI